MIDHTTGQRLDIWSTALKGLEEHPILGQGPMTYLHICDRLGGYYTFHSHNLYVYLFLELWGNWIAGNLLLRDFPNADHYFPFKAEYLHQHEPVDSGGPDCRACAWINRCDHLQPADRDAVLLLCTSMGIQAREKRPVVLVQLPELEPLRRIRWLHARFGRGSGVYSIKR